MRRHLALVAICIGYLMVIVDATIVNVALPSIGRDFRSGVSWLQVGARRVHGGVRRAAAVGRLARGQARLQTRFIAGLTRFCVASAGCALASSIEVLVIARASQAVGAALLVPSSLALLRAGYDDPRERLAWPCSGRSSPEPCSSPAFTPRWRCPLGLS